MKQFLITSSSDSTSFFPLYNSISSNCIFHDSESSRVSYWFRLQELETQTDLHDTTEHLQESSKLEFKCLVILFYCEMNIF